MTSVADSGLSLPKKKSLLDKLDVPVHNLDFDYVRKCTDVKQLEKIIKILRSKEEGHYPELEACAENQLAALDNRHRLLRHSSKVMTKADLSKEEWNNITSDILNWKGGVENKDLEIFEAKSRTPNGTLPNIRSSSKGFRNSKPLDKSDKTHRISSLDYKSWEKFDADEECKKMDIEEEQKQSVVNRANDPGPNEKLSASVEEMAVRSLGDISHLSWNEREVMAVREKDIGNEFYNTNKVEDAITHYTRSIHLNPTVAGLNNRAAAYLRQCAFSKALDDLNKVLEMDPMNVKARFRRAQSFQHKNMFREALEDINVVLMKEPTHPVAGHIADQLRVSVSKLPKLHRIKMKDRETGKIIIKKVTEKEMLNDYKDEKFIEVNDWGFPKIMCNCNGEHSGEPGIRHENRMRYQHLAKNDDDPRKSEKAETHKPKRRMPVTCGADNAQQRHEKVAVLESAENPHTEKHPGKKLEILEVDKSWQETENDRKDAKNPCVVADMRTVTSPAVLNVPKVEILSDANRKISELVTTKAAVKTGNPDSLTHGRSSLDSSLMISEHFEENVESRTSHHESSNNNTEKGEEPLDPLIEESPRNRDKSPQHNSGKSFDKSGNNAKLQKPRDLSPKTGNDKYQKTNLNFIIRDMNSAQTSPTEFTDAESSIPHLKGVKTDKNSRLQDNRTMNGHHDDKPELGCGCSKVFNKFQFKKQWSVFTGPKSLERKAELLKAICPEHLVKAFGNSWEKEMLVDVFECLRHHFSPNEQQRVAEYLAVVPKLDRFKINAMFLSNEERSLARELVKNCSAHLDSKTVSAFPS